MKHAITRGLWSALFSIAVSASPITAAHAEDAFHLGGAIRFTQGWLDYGANKGLSDPDVELLRVDLAGRHGPAIFSAQYRWYDGFDAVHHAWVGWSLDAERDLRLGIQKVPFGLLPYASQSFWFGSGYYLGLEDDYDAGIVWRDERGDRSWHVGLFLRDEYGTGANFDRYSFDVATTEALPYREIEHGVLRYERRFSHKSWQLALGASGVLGRIENRDTGATHGYESGALHVEASLDAWTVQFQWARYHYRNPENRIALAAFMFPFEVAAKADVLTANVFHDFDMSSRWLDSLRCYNNLSTTQASGEGLTPSWQNVTGCSIGKGAMFTYIDWIAGRNMWFVGGPGVGIDEPGGDRWRSRLNINVGFYF